MGYRPLGHKESDTTEVEHACTLNETQVLFFMFRCRKNSVRDGDR